MFTSITFGKAQNKTDIATNSIKSETEEAVTTQGPNGLLRYLILNTLWMNVFLFALKMSTCYGKV
jgi:hypothetical protein